MKFYVNKNEQWTGEHEVHRANCAWLPDAANRIYLASFTPLRRLFRKHVSTTTV